MSRATIVIEVWAMGALDFLAIMSFVLMSLAFYFIRCRINMFCVAVVLCFVVVTWQFVKGTYFTEMSIMIAGLMLYWFGLFMVRLMLRRSVSLHLLLSYAGGQPVEKIKEKIASRFDDARRYHLVFRKDDVYSLTPFGRLIASIMALLYTVVRIKK